MVLALAHNLMLPHGAQAEMTIPHKSTERRPSGLKSPVAGNLPAAPVVASGGKGHPSWGKQNPNDC